MSIPQALHIESSIKKYSEFIAINCSLVLCEIQKRDSERISIAYPDGCKFKSKGEKDIMQERINHHKDERDNVPWIPKEEKKQQYTSWKIKNKELEQKCEAKYVNHKHVKGQNMHMKYNYNEET